jgi:hypothetical protein
MNRTAGVTGERIRPIDPKIWEIMLAVPGWTPPSEATILRAIMEGRAKVIWSQYIQGPETGFAMLRVGEPSEADTDDAFESMTWMAERKLKRLRAKKSEAEIDGDWAE